MSRPNTFTCFLCGRRKYQGECEQSPVLKLIVCDDCREKHEYSTKNTKRVGSSSKHVPPFSVEFEVAAPCFSLASRLERALILIKYGFLSTIDETVDVEYKSPIYQSLRSFYRPLGIMHKLRDLVTYWCGTHLHVSFSQKARLWPIQDEVFAPLLAQLANNGSETASFWGRGLCKFATNSSQTRLACFSLWSNHDTIEYRLPRFSSAKQYLGVVRFCIQVTTYLDTSLDPDTQNDYRIAPDQMANQVLAFYHEALAHPVTSLPSLTKGGFCYV